MKAFVNSLLGWIVPRQKGVIAKEKIRKYLPAKPAVVDAGAHVGLDTIEMANQWHGSMIYAFEPVPELFRQLEKNTSALRNVKCFELALGAHLGEQKMYLSSGGSDGSSSLLRPKEHLVDHPEVLFEKDVIVKTITLDAWAEKEGVSRIDLLWLDLQGFELNVLRASPRILSTVQVIYSEVSVRETYDGVPLYAEFRTWLAQRGFVPLKEAIPRGWDSGNVLFVRRS